MNRQPVKSSRIKSMGHDPESNMMQVEFAREGELYNYLGVNASQYTKILTAKSIGKEFHAQFGKAKGIPADAQTIAKAAQPKKSKPR